MRHDAPPLRTGRRRVTVREPEGTPVAFGWRDGDTYWSSVPGQATFCFRPSDVTVAAYPDAGADPAAVENAFNSIALPLAWQVMRRGQALHASGVASPGFGVVGLCGLSGSGKTTLAHAMSRNGASLWADDVLAFDPAAPGGTIATSLPFEPNLRPASARHLGARSEVVRGRPWDVLPLAALCILGPSRNKEPSVRRLPPTQAFTALLEHVFRFEPAPRELRTRLVREYLDLIADVPVFRVRFRKSFRALPRLVEAIEHALIGVADAPT